MFGVDLTFFIDLLYSGLPTGRSFRSMDFWDDMGRASGSDSGGAGGSLGTLREAKLPMSATAEDRVQTCDDRSHTPVQTVARDVETERHRGDWVN